MFDRASGAGRATPIAGCSRRRRVHPFPKGSEIGARQGVIGTQRQRMPVGIGGRGILAVQQQDASERRQDFGVPWRSFASVQKNNARFATFIAVEGNRARSTCRSMFSGANASSLSMTAMASSTRPAFIK